MIGQMTIAVLGTGFAMKILMILIVEDEHIARKALARLLSSRGFEITAVATAEEALDIVGKSGSPEMALVDLNLPGMDGLCFLQQLASKHPDVPAVLMTATGSERVHIQIHDDGVKCAYVRKPVDFHRLLSLIDQQRHHSTPMQAQA